MNNDYAKLAKEIAQKAKKKGAKEADVFLQVGREASVRVREGEIEDLKQATSKGVGLRVFSKNKLGFAYTSDFSKASIDRFIEQALALAKASAPDPLNGLPNKSLRQATSIVGGLFDEKVANLPPEWKINASLEMEKAAKGFDSRIKTFESVGAGETVSETHLATSDGSLHSHEGTHVFLYAVPVATDGTQLQTSYWVDYKRFFDELDAPEKIGREAAHRAVRMLGAKKAKSQAVPVIFDPMMSASFVASIAAAANGDAVYKKSSFLAPLRGKSIASGFVNLIDDGLLPRGLGTVPFDGEGVPTRRTSIIEEGVLSAFLYDSFTAKKAKAQTTGNASRGYSSLPHIGTHNLYLEPGTSSPEEMIRGVKNGFYVTAMLGSGANIVTGEYSRGANGLWIRDGALAEPVQEVTVASHMLEMLKSLDCIGNDLTFRGSVGAPTIRFANMTVSGE